MNRALTSPSDPVFRFGPFELNVPERILLKDGSPVDLGARALDLLICLLLHNNEHVSKRDLLAQVWPDVVVEEGNLRFHIAALRKALGDGEDGARYITTLPGRGYCFVAPITTVTRDASRVATETSSTAGVNLPPKLRRMIGRSTNVSTVTTLLRDSRFVTIVGSGGVGKTTVAVAVAHELLSHFTGAVHFLDLGSLTSEALVAPSVASLLSLSVQSEDPTPSLVAYLRDKRMLLVFDNCEHLIDACAALTTQLFLAAPNIYILATSREALRVEGEQIYKLMPLAVPPDDQILTARTALAYSAVELFVERALASGANLGPSDSEAKTIAEICRKLDGLTFAIEITAGRVGAYGLSQTLALLDQRLNMLWLGQRTAPPRQKTLRALLDWSYELLSEMERSVLHRLSVFVGPFTVEAAIAVVADDGVDESMVFSAIDSLVAKSMVGTSPIGTVLRYRLPETTRAYLLEISAHQSEIDQVAQRHANYFLHWLAGAEADWPTLSRAPGRALLIVDVNNVRAALEWCFGPKGNLVVAVQLAAAAAPLFLALSLLTECLQWSERALVALHNAEEEEMQLQAAFGMAFMFTRGNGEPARAALRRSLSIATSRNDAQGELRALSLLHMYYRRIGDYRAAFQCAERSSELAKTTDESSAIAVAHTLLGVSFYHIGDFGAARAELEAALDLRRGKDWTSIAELGFNHFNLSSAILARTLWLQGWPVQAVELARETVREAEQMDHPVTMSIAFTWALTVFLWTGDLESAAETLKYSFAYSAAHSLTPNLMQGRGFEGELALRHGDIDGGIKKLQDCLREIQTARYSLLTTPFSIALAHGLIVSRRAPEAVPLLDDAIEFIKASGELLYMPELLRLKGTALIAAASSEDGERYLTQALDWSKRQGAKSWELRAAIDLASFWAEQGKASAARSLLQPLLASFAEGRNTMDLVSAERLLASLG